ncbi:MAG TPA: F0F1 ATP synthase subunit delta [Candidatus Limnocylindrales bacterium]|nr:F0F1 ATP synthase subunit delta [Candidatus Limnocylindrales bacterium]
MARRDTAPRRYADAAFELALRDGTVEVWRRELEAAAGIVADPAIMAALASPAIPVDQRLEAAQRGFAKLSQPVRNLILLLVRRGRIEQLPRVAAEFARRDDARKGLTHATATSAVPLGAEEVRAIATHLERLTGGRVDLKTNVDPSILGGVVVRIGDRLIDGSVRGRLERLRGRLASGAL